MFSTISFKKLIRVVILIVILFLIGVFALLSKNQMVLNPQVVPSEPPIDADIATPKTDFIKWVDFNVSYEALQDAMTLDIQSHGTDNQYNWIDLLAYLATQNGNNFSKYTKKDLAKLTDKLKNGQTIEALTQNMKYFKYYKESFTAILGGFIGDYKVQIPNPENNSELIWQERYGLKVFSPIARNFGFNAYDDFASSRSYGYKRLHTGHDLFGGIGTPVIAIESGIVECVGWNQYGGWRIGIRSFDKKRYYYYAHLRKGHPYTEIVKQGATIKAGDVIGYLGMTGYSTKENVNNINVPHLHMGLQIIFDESQKDGPKEIWVDTYNIVKLLQKNKSAVYKDENKEYYRKYDFYENQLDNN